MRLWSWVILTLFQEQIGRGIYVFTADNAPQISDGVLRGYQSDFLAKLMVLCRGLIT